MHVLKTNIHTYIHISIHFKIKISFPFHVAVFFRKSLQLLDRKNHNFAFICLTDKL